MKRSDITKGPWHMGQRAGAEHGAIYGESGEEIALPLGFFMEDHEAKANAQAIASIPDLLDALEAAAIHTHAMTLDGYTIKQRKELAASTNVAIRAALTKAGYTF